MTSRSSPPPVRPRFTVRASLPVVASWALAAPLVPAILYGVLAEQPYRGASAPLALGSRPPRTC